MGVLRSVAALQMYQRATRGPIDGPSVVRFLLFYTQFPRSVRGCLDEMRGVLTTLPRPDDVITVLDQTTATLMACAAHADDGARLDDAMDEVQHAIGELDASHRQTFPGSRVLIDVGPRHRRRRRIVVRRRWACRGCATGVARRRTCSRHGRRRSIGCSSPRCGAPRARPAGARRRAGGVDRQPSVAARPDPRRDRHRDVPLVVVGGRRADGALEAMLADLYGARTLVRDGVVPADVLDSTDRYRLAAVGSTHRRAG